MRTSHRLYIDCYTLTPMSHNLPSEPHRHHCANTTCRFPPSRYLSCWLFIQSKHSILGCWAVILEARWLSSVEFLISSSSFASHKSHHVTGHVFSPLRSGNPPADNAEGVQCLDEMLES